MGLDLGGACHGVAYKIAPADWQATIDYLREREQVTSVYLETSRTIRLLDETQRKVRAITYRADHNHRQYAGALDIDAQIRLIRQGHGQSGSAVEYVLSTAAHLQEMGVQDNTLQTLARQLSPSRKE